MVQPETMDPAQEYVANLMERNKAMDAAIEKGDSPIQQFYAGATVFMTGGSGFLGKQLIEKLLRATKVSKLYVLLRPKKGKTVEERLKGLLKDTVYDVLREKQPDFANKIIPVPGDVAELRLGMTDQDWNTIAEEVNIIFHVAATTRFDDTLRVTTMINIRGTREALLLGKACKKLRSYVHVSTAYSHACIQKRTEVLEDFYQSPIQPGMMIQLAETMDEDRLKNITPNLIKDWPNTYSFGKAVAEELVRTMSDGLPICVVRPAIVIHSVREPYPGWVDMSNVYGASGLGLGIGLGLSHIMLIENKVRLALTPVDYVNNAIIAASVETGKRWTIGDTKPKIYTVTTSMRNPGVWCDTWKIIRKVSEEYPSACAVAYSFKRTTNSPAVFRIATWLLHLIPAYILDGINGLMGKEKRFVKICTKMYGVMVALSHFTLNDWDFIDDNTADLYDGLSNVDQKIFDFDVRKIDWREFMVLWSLAIRKCIVNDELSKTEYARKKQFILKIFTYIAYAIYFFLLYKFACLSFGASKFINSMLF